MQAYMRIYLYSGDACDMFYGTMNSCAAKGAFFMRENNDTQQSQRSQEVQ